jgi:hypothetical protein
MNEGKDFDLRVLSINERSDTYSIPNCDSLDTLSPFSDLYCHGSSTTPYFDLGKDPVHRDVPVQPNVYGEIQNVGGRQVTVILGSTSGQVLLKKNAVPADGGKARFSFYVPNGHYKILRIEDEKGNNLLSSPEDIPSGSEVSISL